MLHPRESLFQWLPVGIKDIDIASLLSGRKCLMRYFVFQIGKNRA